MFVAAGLVAFIVGASVVSADFSLDDWLYLKPIVLAVDRGGRKLWWSFSLTPRCLPTRRRV